MLLSRDGFRLIQLQRELQIRGLVPRKLNGIHAGVARGAVGIALGADRREQAVEAEIADAVGFDVLPDFLERVRGADELRPLRGVDTVETWRNRRRATD